MKQRQTVLQRDSEENPKLQTPNPQKTQIRKIQNLHRSVAFSGDTFDGCRSAKALANDFRAYRSQLLGFVIWVFWGIWILEFGILVRGIFKSASRTQSLLRNRLARNRIQLLASLS